MTGAGTVLAFITGALPQFGEEKSGETAKRNGDRTIALTPGQIMDATEIIVIRGIRGNVATPSLLKGSSKNVDANVLYQSFNSSSYVLAWTQLTTAILAACCIILLIILSGFPK